MIAARLPSSARALAALALAGAVSCSAVSGLDDIRFDGGGNCTTDGTCDVACKGDGDCATHDPCTTGTCGAEAKCVFTALDGVDVPAAVDAKGDCRKPLCVAGRSTSAIDERDVPAASGSSCLVAACTQGEPDRKKAQVGTRCDEDGGAVCDATGACVVCNVAADCPAAATPCLTAICSANTCSIGPRPAGPSNTLDDQQIDGDCHQVVCDGSGNATTTNDDDPPTDGNPCTTDGCQNGSATHAPVADNTPCGSGLACRFGQCFGCNDVSQCPQNPNERCNNNVCSCSASSCRDVHAFCGKIEDGCGQTLDCDDHVRNGNETDVDCGGASCTPCGQGKRCQGDGDCATGHCVDGVCCESACSGTCSSCSNATTGAADGLCKPTLAGQAGHGGCASEAASTCGTTGKCDGAGACAFWPTTTVCRTTCSDLTQTLSTCQAPNVCAADHTVSCEPYICDGNDCTDTCLFPTQCAPGYSCSNGRCR